MSLTLHLGPAPVAVKFEFEPADQGGDGRVYPAYAYLTEVCIGGVWVEASDEYFNADWLKAAGDLVVALAESAAVAARDEARVEAYIDAKEMA